MLALAAVCFSCFAWDTTPHRIITKAALDTLPVTFAAEDQNLIDTYCMYPDRYVEMVNAGFARKGPGPRTPEEIAPYCVRPDGFAIHSAAFVRDTDFGSLLYVSERLVTSLSEHHNTDAAKYAGVLAHFIEDSLSPPHAVLSGEIDPAVHSILERATPPITLGARKPKRCGAGLFDSIGNVLDRLYAAADQNRTDLPDMIRAAAAKDETTLNRYRARAAKSAAELLADTLYTLIEIGSK